MLLSSPFGGVSPAQFAMGQPAGVQPNEWQTFMKALTADYGTDLSQLAGGGALRLESLEHVLMATVQSYQHFAMFNRLGKTPAGATVDEWVEMSNIGGRPGLAFNTELGAIQQQQGTYNRRVALVKYLMTRRSVSVVANTQQGIISAKAQEEESGALELLTSAEWGFFNGNSAVVPSQFDGISKILEDLNDSAHVIDAAGQTLDSVGFQLIINAAQVIAKRGNFGVPTDLFLSTAAQTDMDFGLDPAARVPLTNVPNGGVMQGSPVLGVRTSFGDIKNNKDVFIEEGGMPWEAESPAANTTSNPTAPVSVVAAAAQNDAASKFTAAQAGNYYWGVASVNQNGQSAVVKTAQTAIGAGQSVVLTITRSGAVDETGYAIFRSRLNGTNASNDMRLCRYVPYSGNATTTWTDQNRDVPGTSKAFVLNLMPSYNAMSIRQLLPMTKFQLYPTQTAEDPWAQLLFCYLRVPKARHHVMIKNILPNSVKSVWDPFGAKA